MISGYARSGGAKLYFETAGEGAALVFIHAGASDSRMWEPQFERFADRFKVVRYDHRSFGKSDFPNEPYTLRGDLLSVLRHLEIKRAVLIGCSMGGTTAIDFALEHPEMVTGLVLVGSGISGFFDPKNLSADTLKYWRELMSVVQKGEIDKAREMDAKYWIDGEGRSSSQIDPVYRERARQLHRENFSVERVARPETQLTPPAIDRLREIKAPTMVVIGDNDSEDLRKLADRLAGEISGARLAKIRNAAHLPSLEHPVEFNRLLEEFLGSLSTGE